MRYSVLLGAILGVATFTLGASAQEEEAPKPTAQVMTFELQPATMMDWRAAVARMATAAKKHGLSAAENGWWMYNEGNRTVIIWPVPQNELFHNNSIFEKLAEADSSEAAAIGKMFEAAPGRQLSTEIVEMQPEMSYSPANPIEGSPGGVEVIDVVVADGQDDAFNTGAKEYVAILEAIGSPYVMNLYRVRHGMTRVQFVTFFDTIGNYYGANSFDALVAKTPEIGERLQKAYAGWLKGVAHMSSRLVFYDEAGSFPPNN
jgi:hypothetical protein